MAKAAETAEEVVDVLDAAVTAEVFVVIIAERTFHSPSFIDLFAFSNQKEEGTRKNDPMDFIPACIFSAQYYKYVQYRLYST